MPEQLQQSVESPLEEARRLKVEMEVLSEDIEKERQEIEILSREKQMGGIGFRGQKPISEEEKTQEEAQEIIDKFLPKQNES